MARERERIPAKTRDQVLKEFNHRCAKCGADRPHLHHIDEDPSNNDPMNLIPLCPNCHLTDQHNPTSRIETGILRLFRQYKDPTILTPQFHVLHKFLQDLDPDGPPLFSATPRKIDQATSRLDAAWRFLDFVNCLEMGQYYVQPLRLLLTPPDRRWTHQEDPHVDSFDDVESAEQYCEQLRSFRDGVHKVVVELLRFQNWRVSE